MGAVCSVTWGSSLSQLPPFPRLQAGGEGWGGPWTAGRPTVLSRRRSHQARGLSPPLRSLESPSPALRENGHGWRQRGTAPQCPSTASCGLRTCMDFPLLCRWKVRQSCPNGILPHSSDHCLPPLSLCSIPPSLPSLLSWGGWMGKSALEAGVSSSLTCPHWPLPLHLLSFLNTVPFLRSQPHSSVYFLCPRQESGSKASFQCSLLSPDLRGSQGRVFKEQA